MNPHYKPAPSVAQQPVQLKGGEPVLRLRGGGVDDSQSNARKSLVLYGDGVRRKINNDFDSVTDIIKSLVGHLPDEEKTFTFDVSLSMQIIATMKPTDKYNRLSLSRPSMRKLTKSSLNLKSHLYHLHGLVSRQDNSRQKSGSQRDSE